MPTSTYLLLIDLITNQINFQQIWLDHTLPCAQDDNDNDDENDDDENDD